MKGGKTSSAQRWMHPAAASIPCALFAPVDHAALAAAGVKCGARLRGDASLKSRTRLWSVDGGN
jgi:hypothetical protein